MSFFHIQVTGEDTLERAKAMLAGIDGGINRAVRSAMSRVASNLRSNSTKAIQERYAISASSIREHENVRVTYNFRDGVQAEIKFTGRKIPLYRYKGAAPVTPEYDKTRWIKALVDGKMTWVHPGVSARGHLLASTAPTVFENAFVARMKSGHIGIFERTGELNRAGTGSEIQEIMGLSVPQMLGSGEVERKLADTAARKFGERLDHEINRILNEYR